MQSQQQYRAVFCFPSPAQRVMFFLHSFVLFSPFTLVHGPPEAAFDASQAPARLHLFTPCSSTQGASLHFYSDHMSGTALDPKIYSGSYHIPSNGKFM